MELIEFDHSFYSEDRGEIFSFYNEKDISYLKFVQDRCSISYKGGVRGFHGDPQTWKYISCLVGKIHLVTWDIKNKIKKDFILSEENKKSVLIPPNFLNAHQCLSNLCTFMYKQTEYYDDFPASMQWSVFYNDPTINPKWKLEPRRVSNRDKLAPTLKELKI